MFKITMGIVDVIHSIYDNINERIGSNLDYSELYIKPKKLDLYIKTKQGKKTIYKKIDYFYNTDNFNDKVYISLCNTEPSNKDNNKQLELEFEILPGY